MGLLIFLGEVVGVVGLHFLVARDWPRMFGDASQPGEGAGGNGRGLRGGELFLVEKFGEVKNFVDLVFWKRLDELIEFFGGCHGV